MQKVTLEQAYQLAAKHFRSGSFSDAESICKQILQHEQKHCDSLALMGLIAGQMGRDEAAVTSFKKAIKQNSKSHSLHSNLGEGLRRLGRFDEAVAAFQRAIVLKPDYAQAHNNLGVAYKDGGHSKRAMQSFRKAIALQPDFFDACINLGNVLLESNQAEEAVRFFRQALKINGTDARTHVNLGSALVAIGEAEEAAASYRQAIRLNPRIPVAHSNIGNLLKEGDQHDEAILHFQKALELDPNLPEVYNNLGVARVECGQLDEALVAFRRAIELKPDFVGAHSGLLFYLNYDPDCDVDAIAEEHREWNRRHADSLRRLIRPHANDLNPERRLRIGYVSPDFRDHPVSRFILPILENHNPQSFEIFCYADVARPDTVTESCRKAVHHWRDLVGLSDERAAEMIRQDQIDILVDLAMHTSNNRLLVFARKPAPVQVTYLAYAGTTGLSTMDYRLSDPYLDPPGMDESIYSEKTVRLPRSYWCYRPVLSPTLGPVPALEAGHVTFGCLNNFCKVSDATLNLWAQLLLAVPEARLLLHAPEGSSRNRTRNTFERLGVDPERLRFVGRLPFADYLRLYDQIDIALDPIPFGGGTTTCDALWMGVPVVNLAGTRAAGRGGSSILSNLDLADLVASSCEEYVGISAKLSENLPRLKELRMNLRHRMELSPLMNALLFSRDIEAAYQRMWKIHLSHRTNPPSRE